MITPKKRAVHSTAGIVGTSSIFAVVGIAVIIAAVARGENIDFSSWRTLVMPLGGLFMVVVALWQLRQLPVARELDSVGVDGEAIVIGKWTSGDADEGRSCHVAYQYCDGHQAQQEVSRSLFRQLGPGDTVQIRYLARDPSFSRMTTKGAR